MAESKDVIFNNWQKGIAASPYLGLADVRGISLHEMSGALMIGLQATKQSSTTIANLPMWVVINPASGTKYLLDTNGKVYKSTDDGITWSLITGNTLPAADAGGQGLCVWKDYLFVARAAAIDVMKISDETWSNSWQSISSADFHPMIVTQDDKLTGGAGRYIFTVQETAGMTFAPGSGGTFTFTAQKLTLPAQYKVKCLAQLGLDLKIGTWVGPNLTSVKASAIFSWDRVSTSYAGARTIFMQENGISAMQEVAGLLYFIAGLRSNLYVTGGGAPQLVAEWNSLDFPFGTTLSQLPGAICFHNGKVLVGLSGTGVSPMAVFSYDTRTGAKALETIISSGAVTSDIDIGALFSVNDQTFIIGWRSASAQGADLVGNNGYRVTSYGAYADTDMRRVGITNGKRTFSEAQIILGRDLTANQGVRLQWRKALDDAFTTFGTFDHDTHGAVHDVTLPPTGIPDVVNIQLRVLLTTGSSSTTSPEVLEVRLR